MTLTNLIIFGLASWRVASLLVGENGPWKMFLKLRIWAGILHDEEEQIYLIPDTLLAGVLSCVWCASMWIAFFWTLLWLASPEWSVKIAVPFAFSAIAIIINVIIKREK